LRASCGALANSGTNDGARSSNAYAMSINETEAAPNNVSIPTLSVYCLVPGRGGDTVF
jgi:hypothetical protein